MAFGIYKRGQGYWVRVLTAVFAGVLLFAGAAWLWGQLQAASRWIPTRSWVVSTAGTVDPGTVAPGRGVILLGPAVEVGAPQPEVGRGVVRASGERSIEVESVELILGADPGQITGLIPEGGEAIVARGASAVRAFEPLYIQGAGVAVLLLLGAMLIFWLVAAKPSTSEFLIATDGEMKKVNWSTRKDVIASTWVVILWAMLIATGLFMVDTVFASFFRLIGVLQS
jgi:preprotein translocase SecE subunit